MKDFKQTEAIDINKDKIEFSEKEFGSVTAIVFEKSGLLNLRQKCLCIVDLVVTQFEKTLF